MSSSRPPWVAGNWKMHGSLADNAALVAAIRKGLPDRISAEVVLCVPFPYLDQVSRLLSCSMITLAAQDVSKEAKGAFTGDVSAMMLADFGCRYVLVGHSERRQLHGETDAKVAEKFGAALRVGIRPVLCLGETLAEREAGQTEEVVIRQLEAILTLYGAAAFQEAVLAYEPIWAIGTGRVAAPHEAEAVHSLLRARVAVADASVAAALRIVYGGSIKADNAPLLFAQANIDGGLIGGASLQAEDFLTICHAANF
ncbi:MAG: triose-phosphate isomerase [Betaproteobacteria bacterium]|nr:triose-phosphate isomerase [Betaproteobacteria bacterium]